MGGPKEFRYGWDNILSKFDEIPTLSATYLTDNTNYIRKLYQLTRDLLSSLRIDPFFSEQIMNDFRAALTNRERLMTFLHAFVDFFEPYDSERLRLYWKYQYFGHVEALSILKSLIIMNEEETHEHHSIQFHLHPTTVYSILGRLSKDGCLSEERKTQFLNNAEFQAALIEAANHLTAIKVCFDELVMILGVQVDEAENCIVAGKWTNLPADFPNDASSVLQCIMSNVIAPYRSMVRNDYGGVFQSSYENLLDECWWLRYEKASDVEWYQKVFRFRYKHIPTLVRRRYPSATAAGGIKKKSTYRKHRSKVTTDFQCMVPASANKENKPADDDNESTDSGLSYFWKSDDDDDGKMM